MKYYATAALSAALMLSAASVLAEDLAKLQIGDNQGVFPESITSLSDGTVIAGSMAGIVFKGKLGDAFATPWLQPVTEGPPSVTGVYADEATGLLWVCNVDMAAFAGGDAQPSVLRTYSLADGALKGAYPLPEKSFCNDIATAADGTAYVADTTGARIMRLKPGATELETWHQAAELGGVDGLDFNDAGELFINNVMNGKLHRVGINADGAFDGLQEIATSAPLMGPDGMRFGADGRLFVAENGAGRVSALTITGDNAEVDVLHEGFDFPTAVTLQGDNLLVGEARFSQMQNADPGQFYAHVVPLK